MKKLVLAFVILLTACHKDAAKPMEEPKTTQSAPNISSAFNYSTTINSSGLTPAELITQSVDTTYYEIRVNGVKKAEWKANWNYVSAPNLHTISNLSSVTPINSGDVVQWKVIHRSPRAITEYKFNAGISSNGDRVISGMFQAQKIESGSAEYKPGYESFMTVIVHKID